MRIRIFLATLLSVVLFCYGANVVQNPGFETGDTPFASWTEAEAGSSTVNDETSDVHGGSHACRLDIDASNNAAQVYQSITLTIGNTYEIIIWYKMSTSGKTGAFVIQDLMSNIWLKSDGTWQSGVPTSVQLANATDWTKFSLQFTVSSYTSYVLYIKNDSAASASVYIDDVSIDSPSGSDVKGTVNAKGTVNIK